MTQYETILNKDMHNVTVRIVDADTAANYGAFFVATRPYEVMEIHAVWSVASTSGTLMVERLTGTTAEGSGDNILKSTIDMSGTANTVVTRKGTQLQNRQLKAGDRLALEDGGTLTNQDNLIITILLKPLGKGDYR